MIQRNEPFQDASENQNPQANRDFIKIPRAAQPFWGLSVLGRKGYFTDKTTISN